MGVSSQWQHIHDLQEESVHPPLFTCVRSMFVFWAGDQKEDNWHVTQFGGLGGGAMRNNTCLILMQKHGVFASCASCTRPNKRVTKIVFRNIVENSAA